MRNPQLQVRSLFPLHLQDKLIENMKSAVSYMSNSRRTMKNLKRKLANASSNSSERELYQQLHNERIDWYALMPKKWNINNQLFHVCVKGQKKKMKALLTRYLSGSCEDDAYLDSHVMHWIWIQVKNDGFQNVQFRYWPVNRRDYEVRCRQQEENERNYVAALMPLEYSA